MTEPPDTRPAAFTTVNETDAGDGLLTLHAQDGSVIGRYRLKPRALALLVEQGAAVLAGMVR